MKQPKNKISVDTDGEHDDKEWWVCVVQGYDCTDVSHAKTKKKALQLALKRLDRLYNDVWKRLQKEEF